MKLVPLGDRVVLKQLEAEETTKSGTYVASVRHIVFLNRMSNHAFIRRQHPLRARKSIFNLRFILYIKLFVFTTTNPIKH